MWISWHDRAWSEYVEWRSENRKVAARINMLVKELSRSNPSEKPLGRAERLKRSKHGLCSVRIDHGNRLVYKLTSDELRIVACKGHYEVDENGIGF